MGLTVDELTDHCIVVSTTSSDVVDGRQSNLKITKYVYDTEAVSYNPAEKRRVAPCCASQVRQTCENNYRTVW